MLLLCDKQEFDYRCVLTQKAYDAVDSGFAAPDTDRIRWLRGSGGGAGPAGTPPATKGPAASVARRQAQNRPSNHPPAPPPSHQLVPTPLVPPENR